MTRVQFFSLTNYEPLNEPISNDSDKGINTHSKFEAAMRNFFAIFGFCSMVFEYKVGDETLYLNRASFNNWLQRHEVVALSKEDCENIEVIQDLMLKALKFKPKETNNENAQNNNETEHTGDEITFKTTTNANPSGDKKAEGDVF